MRESYSAKSLSGTQSSAGGFVQRFPVHPGDLLSIFVTTSRGCEEALLEETKRVCAAYDLTIKDMDSSDIAGIGLSGNFTALAGLNLTLTTASRVLWVVATATIRSWDELQRAVAKVSWSKVFSVRKTFVVRATSKNSFASNTLLLAQKTKDAIADVFRAESGERPYVDTSSPDISIVIHLNGSKLVVAIDTSGEPLSNHGFRTSQADAPLRENVVASILRYAGWCDVADSLWGGTEPIYLSRGSEKAVDRSDQNPGAPEKRRRIPQRLLLAPFLLDPMCGSGTIAIEAGLYLLRRKPNARRKVFAFQNLIPFAAREFVAIVDELRTRLVSAEKSPAECLEKCLIYAGKSSINLGEYKGLHKPIHCSDRDPVAIRLTRQSIQSLGLETLIDVESSHFEQVRPHASAGIVILNPPYGKRLEAEEDLTPLYKGIGNHLKHNFASWTAWILSGNEEALKQIGLRPTRNISIRNGEIECKLRQFALYPTRQDKNNIDP